MFLLMENPSLGLKSVRAIALGVTDEARANEFYGKTLGLPAAIKAGVHCGADFPGYYDSNSPAIPC